MVELLSAESMYAHRRFFEQWRSCVSSQLQIQHILLTNPAAAVGGRCISRKELRMRLVCLVIPGKQP